MDIGKLQTVCSNKWKCRECREFCHLLGINKNNAILSDFKSLKYLGLSVAKIGKKEKLLQKPTNIAIL